MINVSTGVFENNTNSPWLSGVKSESSSTTGALYATVSTIFCKSDIVEGRTALAEILFNKSTTLSFVRSVNPSSSKLLLLTS